MVKTPHAPTCCLEREFWTAAAKKPTAPPKRPPLIPDLMASLWWKKCSSGRVGMGCGFAILILRPKETVAIDDWL